MTSLRTIAGALLVASSMSSCDTDTPDEPGDTGFPDCPERTEHLEFVYANKSCSTAADCAWVESDAPSRESCSGGFYLNKGVDSNAWKELDAAGSGCPWGPRENVYGCLLNPPPPLCWNGECWPNNPDVSEQQREQCLEKFGTSTACSRCVCAQFPAMAACFVDDACREIAECAVNANCIFNALCAPTNASSPCNGAVSKAGGSSSAAAQWFAALNALGNDTGCDVLCFPK